MMPRRACFTSGRMMYSGPGPAGFTPPAEHCALFLMQLTGGAPGVTVAYRGVSYDLAPGQTLTVPDGVPLVVTAAGLGDFELWATPDLVEAWLMSR